MSDANARTVPKCWNCLDSGWAVDPGLNMSGPFPCFKCDAREKKKKEEKVADKG